MKTLARKYPASAEVWQGDNYEEIKKFLFLEDNDIIRDGLNLILKINGREIEVPVGWYIVVEDAITDSSKYCKTYVKSVPPEFVSEIYEII